jgi:Cu/Ag efflux pump CusA
MLCPLATFLPTLFVTGAGKAMFLPLSLAVGFSMIASYLLSSTLVPILSVWVLRRYEKGLGHQPEKEGSFARFRKRYANLTTKIVRVRWLVLTVYLVLAGLIIVLIGRQLGTEIFPALTLASCNCGSALRRHACGWDRSPRIAGPRPYQRPDPPTFKSPLGSSVSTPPATQST